jgi:hypothetical protein
VKWNDGLLSDSLEALKMTVGFVVNKVMVVEPPTKKVAESLVKQGLLRKGFLNPHSTVSITPDSPREVIDVGVVGPSSPWSGCIIPSFVEGNGFSLSRDWPVSFDHDGKDCGLGGRP